jgi:hypothetical protein
MYAAMMSDTGSKLCGLESETVAIMCDFAGWWHEARSRSQFGALCLHAALCSAPGLNANQQPFCFMRYSSRWISLFKRGEGMP